MFSLTLYVIDFELREDLTIAISLIIGYFLLQVCDLICIHSLYKTFEEEAFPSLVDSRSLTVTYHSTPSNQLPSYSQSVVGAS